MPHDCHAKRVAEAPPGFEPGMSDLQSDALATWLRRLDLDDQIREPLTTNTEPSALAELDASRVAFSLSVFRRKPGSDLSKSYGIRGAWSSSAQFAGDEFRAAGNGSPEFVLGGHFWLVPVRFSELAATAWRPGWKRLIA